MIRIKLEYKIIIITRLATRYEELNNLIAADWHVHTFHVDGADYIFLMERTTQTDPRHEKEAR